MADKEKKQAAVKSKSHKKKIKKAIISIILIGCITVIVVFNVNNKKDDTKTATVTKENTAKKGNLIVGITESGTMEIGSITQSYELDTSSVGTSSSSSSSGTSSSSSSSSGSSNKSDAQGMQNMGGAMGMAGGQSGSDSSSSTTKTTSSSSGNESVSDSDLVIKKVCITSGQNVKKGDTILKLTTKSVSNVRKLYKAAVSSAKLSLKEAKVDRDSDKLTAEYEYKERIAAGKSAKTTYKATLQSLDSAVVTAQNNYNTAVSGIKTLPSKIKILKKKIKKAGGSTTVYSSTSTNQNTGSNAGNNTGNMAGTGIGNDKNGGTSGIGSNTGTTAGSTGSQSSSNTVTIMQQLASYQQQLSEYKSNLKNLKSQLKSAKKARKTGKVSAKKTYDAAMLQYSNAKTLYNVAMDGIDDDVKDAQETLKDAQKALKTFEKYAGTGVIKAECSGTVTSVGYEDGETLSTDTDIATYMNSDAVTTSVSVAQDDISEIEVGDTVNISLSAYEGKTFHGKVTSISTTSSGTSTVSYPVVVTMTGDVSSIYAGMSADVTFVTKEVKDVLYISNKAVETEGTKSYVIKKNSDASTTKTQVKTGFSDGHNVQIESGLSEGDTVLIESRVSE